VKEQAIVGGGRREEAELSRGCGWMICADGQLLLRVRLLEQLNATHIQACNTSMFVNHRYRGFPPNWAVFRHTGQEIFAGHGLLFLGLFLDLSTTFGRNYCFVIAKCGHIAILDTS